LISNLVVAPLFKLRGRKVIFWGHGAEPIGDFGGVLRRLLVGARHAKRWMARRGDGYLAYTEGGQRALIAAGFSPERVFVVRNTIDTEEQELVHGELLGADPQRLRRELGLSPSSVVLLYVGSVYPEKRLEQMIEVVGGLASEQTTKREIELVVIGDGPDLEMIRARAAGLPGVHFRGKVMDQEEVGRYMRVAAAVVYAGGVGLAVNHAFSQGVPVIMRADAPHGPEAEYVEDGSNGLVVDGTLDRFSEVLARFVDSPAEQERLASGALASRDALGIEQMARNFDAGVKAVLGYPSESGAAANGNAALASSGEPLPEHPDPRPVS
jgi:glycosyltransferase involved in cell wall biosynthesis